MEIIVYAKIEGKIEEIGLCSKDWNLLPHGILKIVIPQKEGYTEIFGRASYITYKGHIGGIHQTKFNNKHVDLEKLIPNPPDNLKFGVALSDKEWLKFTKLVEDRLYGR